MRDNIMQTINFNMYQVYYMDNNRQKIIIAKELTYSGAVELYQSNNSKGLSCEYEAI